MTDGPDLRVVDAAAGEEANLPLAVDFADMDRDVWLEVGRRLGSRAERDRWALGDWAHHGDRRYGDLTEAAAEIGISYSALRSLSSVARKVELYRRRHNLSWSHHEAVAPLPPEIGDELLDRAAAEGWSREVIRSEARAAGELGQRDATIAQLRKDLAAARTDRATAEGHRRRMAAGVDAAAREILRQWREVDILTEAFFEANTPDGASELHGHAGRGAAAQLRRRLLAVAAKINEVAGRVDARLIAAGAPADAHTPDLASNEAGE